jgi:anti-sigma regulatory factor (Ser/Thr protein kinase)
MTARLMSPVISGPSSRAIVRCLHGSQPEHRARSLVTDVLARAGIVTELPDIELAVNELVTNARQHAPGPYELRIVFDRYSVKVAVMDSGADYSELARKLLQAAAGELADGESGRGLQIVTGLFPGSWGTEPASTCTGQTPAKQVWIMIARPVQPGHRDVGTATDSLVRCGR